MPLIRSISDEFQFSPLREGRPRFDRGAENNPYFNSRPCERGDAALIIAVIPNLHFNSRPCERGDMLYTPAD